MLAARLAPIQPGMTDVFVIRNQHGLFLGKHGDWIDGQDAHSLYRTMHKDEAINVKVEHSVRDPLLRLQIVTCSTNEKGEPRPLDTRQAAAGEIDQTPPILFTAGNEQADAAKRTARPVATPAGSDFDHNDSNPDFS